MRLEDAAGGFRHGSESRESDSDGEVAEEGCVTDEEDEVINEEEMMDTSPRDNDDDENDFSDEIDQSPNAGF